MSSLRVYCKGFSAVNGVITSQDDAAVGFSAEHCAVLSAVGVIPATHRRKPTTWDTKDAILAKVEGYTGEQDKAAQELLTFISGINADRICLYIK